MRGRAGRYARGMSGIGSELRAARERARLSLPDLSARTKIRPALLEAMEGGHFERLPPGLLARGFLRAYAREVGLEPESLVRRYLAEIEADRPAPEEPRVEAASAPSWTTRLLPVAVAAASVAALVWFRLGDGRAPRAPVASVTPAVIEAPGAQRAVGGDFEQLPPAAVQHAEELAGDATLAVAGDRLALEIRPTADVWVGAVADGRQVVYGLMAAGEQRLIEADREIRLRIGDAAAFAYSVNGVPGRPLGGPGQVRDLQITRDNYETFLIRD